MNEIERLKVWLIERNYSLRQLAREMGMPYQTLYHQVIVRERITGDTRWIFMQRFGLDDANRIFDADPKITGVAPDAGFPNVISQPT